METIKVGDYIRLDNGRIGEITGTPSEGVFFVNGYMMCTEAHFVEKVDKKTAFLTELKELLIKYNVEIDAYGDNYGDFGIGFNFADDSIWYSNDWSERTNFEFPITPSNIFDYDK